MYFPKQNPTQVIDCQEISLGRRRSRLCKDLNTFMPGALRTGVSQISVYFHGILLNVTFSDLHPGNVVFANTTQQDLSDTDFIMSLGKPRTDDVMATYGASLTPRIPRYLVWPTSLLSPAREVGDALVKIVDFGEASLQGQPSKTHSLLVFRAPETIFASQQDLQTDVWSLACTVRAS